MDTNSVSKAFDLAVVGGGPAGLMAAWRAASLGAKVLLLEKGNKLGRKLSLAGGRRGNFTHAASRTDLVQAFYGQTQQRFLRPAFSAFNSDDLRQFFSSFGVSSVVENGGKVYPQSGRAQDLVDALEKACLKQAAQIQLHAEVSKVIVLDNDARFCLLINEHQKCALSKVLAHNVLLCTGGKTFPQTGSDGQGYELASSLGHKTSELAAALQAVNLDEAAFAELSGLSLPDVELSFGSKKSGFHTRGELLFTHFGLSGPAALHLSRFLADYDGDELRVDFLPSISEETLMEDLLKFIRTAAKRPAAGFLSLYLPHRLADVLASLIWENENGRKTAAHISKQERIAMVEALKRLSLRLGSLRPLEQGMVTRGGVELREVSAKTMESKLCKGLYLAGEILDIDGPSGGYNLQAVFSSGYLAGTTAGLVTESS